MAGVGNVCLQEPRPCAECTRRPVQRAAACAPADEEDSLTGDENLLGLLQRHLVALLVRVRADSGAKWQIATYTCFVLEMEDQRWLATAGHILKDLYTLLP